MKLKCISFLIVLLINSFSSVYRVESKVFTVGDEDQWNTGTNYYTWSEKYNFTVGDVLAFVYVKGQHNVYEVMESTYKSCNASRGVLATYETGNDEVKLMEAKKHWFICNVDQHCLGGMRFGVDVKDSSAIPINPAPADGYENSGAFRGRGRGWDFLVEFLIFFINDVLLTTWVD